jgi:hypothetical protein
MSIPSLSVRFALCVAIASACGRAAPPVSPSPRAAPAPTAAPAPAPVAVPAPVVPADQPDLAGQWQYTATMGGEVITGTLTLVRSGASYTGSATASTADDLIPMTAMMMNGTKVVMLFETPNGEARLDATVNGGTVLAGDLTMGGQTGTLRAQKRP